MKNEHALSEIFATILIIGLVIVLVGIVVILSSDIVSLTEKPAFITMDISSQNLSTKNIITVFHRAGDEAYLNASDQGQYEVGVYIDTSSISPRAQPVLGVNIFRPGSTLFVYNTTNGYRITDSSVSLSSPAVLSVTACPLGVRVVDEKSKTLIAHWNMSCTIPVPTGPAPTVTSMTNTTGYRGWPVVNSITGTNFLNGATAKFTRAVTQDIPAGSCTFVSSTRIVCTFDLLEKTASPPNYNVVVTNPDGKFGTRASYFVLSSPTPTISSSTPATGGQAATITITNLAGNNFQPGVIVDYYLGGTRINLTGVSVVSRTQITGTLVIPPTAPTGSYGVSVKNTDGVTGVRTGRFTVTSTTPSITARSPTSGNRGWPMSMTITGTNFVSGATVKLNRTGYTDIPGTSVVVVSATQITCTFDLLNVQAGAWNLAVINPDGRGALRTNYFTVNSPAPTVAASPAFSPATGARGTTGLSITAPGTNLQPGMAVVLTRGSTTITAYNVNVVSPTSLIFTIDIPAGAITGLYTARYTNTDGGTNTRTNRFTVT